MVIVLDRSGSMKSIREETEQAMNDLVKEQQALPGKATLSYYTFNAFVHPEFVQKDLSAVEHLSLVPSGMTALHDAIGQAIDSEGSKLEGLPEDERPGKVILVTITDGFENSSREYTADAVKALVEHQTKEYGWEFVFLGANQDAVLTADQYGISRDASLTYAATGAGVATASGLVSNYITTTRSGGQAVFTDSDRQAAVDSSNLI